MSNIDSILKSILKNVGILLCQQRYLVNAVVFPVVMYRYESWTIKKAEYQRTDALSCGVGEDS